MRVIRHFARLEPGRVVLWLFLVWYAVMVALYFEGSPRLWLNAVGMAALVGTALMLSVRDGTVARPGFWRVFRLYAIPFCVSSFSALVRDDGFFAIFAPSLDLNLLALAGCLLFAGGIMIARGIDSSCEDKA